MDLRMIVLAVVLTLFCCLETGCSGANRVKPCRFRQGKPVSMGELLRVVDCRYQAKGMENVSSN